MEDEKQGKEEEEEEMIKKEKKMKKRRRKEELYASGKTFNHFLPQTSDSCIGTKRRHVKSLAG